MKVKNVTNDNYRAIPNQFIIEHGHFIYFQSYDSVIARVNRKTDKTVLDRRYWDYSNVTGKYRNQFLGENITETRAKIAAGVYKLVDLNGGRS